MLKRRPVIAYLSMDGRRVTTWTGGTLGRVVYARPCKLSRLSNWHSDKTFRSVRVVDVHGGAWSGRGSPGVAIKLRPVGGGK